MLLGWRDRVIALEWMDGQGRLLQFGSHAMKNVAGYDVPKLMIGSWGRLGVITTVTLRVRHRHPAIHLGIVRTVCAAALLDLALALAHSYLRPVSLLLRKWAYSPPELVLEIPAGGDPAPKLWVQSQIGRRDAEIYWQIYKDMNDGLDQQRQIHAQAACQTGSFYEGGVVPAELQAVLTAMQPADSFTLFPGSGAYEVYASDALPRQLPGLSRRIFHHVPQIISDRGWVPLIRKIESVFDPAGRFVSPWSFD
jgi:hypothetical protein